jgi:four helix bundle protein
MFSVEKLKVWEKAIEFAEIVYSITGDFPADERFGLIHQMRRAAVSISSNIAEGSSRSSRKDFVRFIEIASGSIYEVISQAYICRNQGLLTPTQFQALYLSADEQSRMLSGLRRSLQGGS